MIRAFLTSSFFLLTSIWERFKRGRSDQEWYYRGLVESLCSQVAATSQGETSGHAGSLSFCQELKRLFRKVVICL
jgi:hypothetical protein